MSDEFEFDYKVIIYLFIIHLFSNLHLIFQEQTTGEVLEGFESVRALKLISNAIAELCELSHQTSIT